MNLFIEIKNGMPAKHLLIKGKVQGVFYRASVKKTADELGIKGWVKNLPEGDVEIVASGDNDSLEKFINWCRQGPPSAQVKHVATDELTTSFFESFEIKR